MRTLLSIFGIALLLAACEKAEMETMVPMPEPDPMPVDSMPSGGMDTTRMDTTAMDTSTTILRKGAFQPQNNYVAEGTASLKRKADNSFKVVLDENFRTSFATGAVTMYLSKAQRLNLSDQSSFIRLAVINTNGSHTFDIEGSVSDDFTHVVIWCAPARIPFGFAALEPL